MSIAAKISAAELVGQVTDRYVNQYYEGILINAPGVTYQPGITVDADFLTDEVVEGTGGYYRQVIKYASGDVGGYADDGVALATKATVFAHDGGGTTMDFTHAALIKGNGNVTDLGVNTAAPTAAVNGTYTNLPVITGGNGVGLTVDLYITGNGATLGDYSPVIVKPGYRYVAIDSLQIQEATLVSVGAVTAGAGSLTFSVASATTGGGAVLAVAQTESAVALSSGNEAAFYWNLKQYGFYTV